METRLEAPFNIVDWLVIKIEGAESPPTLVTLGPYTYDSALGGALDGRAEQFTVTDSIRL